MCIWVERWFMCPQPREGDCRIPVAADGDMLRPVHRFWSHGEVVSESGMRQFNLQAAEGWCYVRHRTYSKVRCAALTSAFCDASPRETCAILYSCPCPDCLGGDRCVPPKPPYTTDLYGHNDLSIDRTAPLARAAQAYWEDLMNHEMGVYDLMGSTVQFEQDVPHGMPRSLARAYHFFRSLACTEDPDHIRPYQGLAVFGESCSNVLNPAAHNALRALRREEAEVVWQALEDDFTNALYDLEEEGYLQKLRDQRSLEDKTPQDWLAEGMLHSNVMFFHRGAMQSLRVYLEQSGDQNEDAEERGYAGSLSELLLPRVWLADRISMLLATDPGLSTGLRFGLVKHLLSIILPWPSQVAKDHGIRCPDPLPQTKRLVSGFDRIFRERRLDVEMSWARRLTRQAYQIARHGMISNEASVRGLCLDHYLTASQVLTLDEALALEPCCPICGDDWISNAESVPTAVHLNITAMPCCGKPLHRRCVRRAVWFNPEYRSTCPMCRCDLQEGFGWAVHRRNTASTHFEGEPGPEAGFLTLEGLDIDIDFD